MPLGIRPTVDFVFKMLFGRDENTDLLIHLLNAVLMPDRIRLVCPFPREKP